MTWSRKIILISFSCLFFFTFDRLLKEILWLKGEFLFLKIIKNPYFIFFFQGFFFYSLIILFFILLIIFLMRSYQRQDSFSVFSFSLILTGGLSNFFDRIFYGYVIDYFNLFSLSVFNLADIIIITGVILLIFKFVISKSKALTFEL